jgi:hypothetical protein
MAKRSFSKQGTKKQRAEDRLAKAALNASQTATLKNTLKSKKPSFTIRTNVALQPVDTKVYSMKTMVVFKETDIAVIKDSQNTVVMDTKERIFRKKDALPLDKWMAKCEAIPVVPFDLEVTTD